MASGANRRRGRSQGGARQSRASIGRRLALEVLREVRERDAFAHSIIESVVNTSSAPREERAFATVLVYGVVSTQGVLDDVLDSHLNRPGDVAPAVRDALRCSAYELLYLQKQSHAAVDQGVELVRLVAPRAAGMANAVLRRVAEDARGFPFGDPEADDVALARLNGFPQWLADRFIEDLGRDGAEQLMQTAQGRAPVFLGVNRFALPEAIRVPEHTVLERLADEGVSTRPFGVDGCLLADDPAAAVASSVLRDGLAIVSDAASQLVARLAAPASGCDFLEVGSGRGTKTVLLQGNAVALGGRPARIHSVDNRAFKTRVLSDRMTELGIPEVHAHTGDATRLDTIEGLPKSFAGVLVDAPCSGLGTLRRHPEERWRVTSEGIDKLSKLQLRLLRAAARVCEPGGFVVYATCTVLRQENEDVVRAFLRGPEGRGFSVADVSEAVPDDFAGCITREGFVRTRTSPNGPDAHFAAKLVRLGG